MEIPGAGYDEPDVDEPKKPEEEVESEYDEDGIGLQITS